MKTVSYLLLLFAFVASCYPTASTRNLPFQYSNDQYKRFYEKFLEDGETLQKTWYHYITSTGPNGENIVRTFFPEKVQITSYVEYKTLTYKTKHGPYKRWYDNGSRRDEGTYIDGKKNGTWKYYRYKSNTLSSTGKYVSSNKEGLWKYYDDENRLTKEVNFLADNREGPFVAYDSIGTVINEGIYKADTIFQQTNNKEEKILVESMPYMSAAKGIADKEERMNRSQEILLQSIYQNVRYPSDARQMGVEGTTITRFVIEKDGSINEVEVLSGICKMMAEECERVIKELPKWEPGTQDGEPVRVYFNMPIRFRLE